MSNHFIADFKKHYIWSMLTSYLLPETTFIVTIWYTHRKCLIRNVTPPHVVDHPVESYIRNVLHMPFDSKTFRALELYDPKTKTRSFHRHTFTYPHGDVPDLAYPELAEFNGDLIDFAWFGRSSTIVDDSIETPPSVDVQGILGQFLGHRNKTGIFAGKERTLIQGIYFAATQHNRGLPRFSKDMCLFIKWTLAGKVVKLSDVT